MMDMNKISPNGTIRFFKIKFTNAALNAIFVYALISGISISLVAIDVYLPFCPFR